MSKFDQLSATREKKACGCVCSYDLMSKHNTFRLFTVALGSKGPPFPPSCGGVENESGEFFSRHFFDLINLYDGVLWRFPL